MATLAESLVSTTSRRLSLRMRPDLEVRKHRYHGEAYWVVKEPIGLNYFRFHEEEFAILQMLDGESSLDSIKERFEADFAPQKITFQDLQQFIGMLHRSGLVISETAGQGRQLAKRRGEKKRREWLGRLTNVFALRWRGVDPERFLTWLYGYTRWIFHPVCVALCLAVGIGALLLITVQFEVFRSRLPTFHEFFDPRSPDKWLYLALMMGVVKVLHELGHGLSCKHFGGECHEIGFMLLVLTPCLYCNVSDSWMLPNKWQRAMIGAAGMYVEAMLAAIATFLWWFSDRSGLLNNLCLNVMFICSVSTLIFNGNPLLRFDGYYILMDLAEIPNLRQKSTEVLKRFMVGVCLGLEQPENPFLPQKNRFLFGAYTVAAVVYRWIIVFSIVFFLIKVFEPIGLKIVGQVVAATGFFGLIVQPLWQLARFFYLPGRMHKVKKHRVIASLAVVGAVLAAVLFLPLPHSVKCEFEVGPRDAAAVYVEVAGRVEEILVKDGDPVHAEQPLMVLSNPDLELSVLELRGQRAVTESRLGAVNREQFADDQSGLQIGQLQRTAGRDDAAVGGKAAGAGASADRLAGCGGDHRCPAAQLTRGRSRRPAADVVRFALGSEKPGGRLYGKRIDLPRRRSDGLGGAAGGRPERHRSGGRGDGWREPTPRQAESQIGAGRLSRPNAPQPRQPSRPRRIESHAGQSLQSGGRPGGNQDGSCGRVPSVEHLVSRPRPLG